VSLEPISAVTRERLGRVRDLLLEQHKLLLDRERITYERNYGPIPSPGAYLKLVIGHEHFAWLKTISSLVVEIDEALAPRSTADQALADALALQVATDLKPDAAGNDFQVRYAEAVAQSSAARQLSVRIEAALQS